MLIISRGIAGFGAGGEYPTCATGATEAADESAGVRKNRGVLVALSTLFAIDMVPNPQDCSFLYISTDVFIGVCSLGSLGYHCPALLW
jgi:MFS family permease